MKIEFIKKEDMPPLAWLAIVNRGKVNLVCGLQVEVNKDFFVEGAWGGKYSTHNFDKVEWFCGTGAIVKNDEIIFSTPTGMHAGLFISKREEKTVVVSNSLPLIMASEGLRLNPKYPAYETFFNYNILQGIKKYKSNVPVIKKNGMTCAEDTLKMILFRNIIISAVGDIKIEMKPEFKGFNSFEEYFERLTSTMRLLAENAADDQRAFKYGVTSLISSGYDCACCAAIAKELGAEKVLTFTAKGRYA